MQRFRERLRKDGWLMLALAAAVVMCLVLGAVEGTHSATDIETRLARVLSAMEGAGQVEVAVFYEQTSDASPEQLPSGAVIVAQGADDISVRLRLCRATSTLLGIEENRVEVFKLEEGH